jgi:transcriptional regulator with PAS, ATPase and Fis domain
MLMLKDTVRKLSPFQDSVLITGETGTGKELIAQALHGERTGKFVALNCGAMPENLLESELFGHVKGAFTGAVSEAIGLMETAENGTLFLDEISTMPPYLQAKLLRVLQEKSIRRVGGKVDVKINCRVVSATNVTLKECKDFRQDLYYRLSTFELQTTPLRHRKNDIPLLVKHLAERQHDLAEYDKLCQTFTESNDHFMILPGNVRELQQIVRRFEVLGELPTL